MEECLRQAVAAGVGFRRDTCARIVESYAAAGKHGRALEALRVLPVLQVVQAQHAEAGERPPQGAGVLLGKLDQCEEELLALHPHSAGDGPRREEATPELIHEARASEDALAFAAWSHSLAQSMAPEVFQCKLSELDFAECIVDQTHP